MTHIVSSIQRMFFSFNIPGKKEAFFKKVLAKKVEKREEKAIKK